MELFREALDDWYIKLIIMSLEDFQKEILLRDFFFLLVNEQD